MSAISDQELVSQYARTRSDAAFRPLVIRYAPLVYRACLGRLGRHDLAEDATQAVFILLAEKAGRLRGVVTLAPWLLSAAKMICLRISRTERRRQRSEVPLTEQIPHGEKNPDVDLVAALENLRGEERDAIVLNVIQGLTHAEVGERLGVSEDAARMRVQRGLARLRTKLAPLSALTPSFIDRLATPSQAPDHLRQTATRRNHPLNLGYITLAPVGVAMIVALIALRPAAESPQTLPRSPKPVYSAPPDSASVQALTSGQKPIQFHFEKYLGKSQDWFTKNIGAAEGAVGLGGGREGRKDSLEWRTYPRRASLGGGMGRMAQATYRITEGFEGQVLSVTFDGPAGRTPVATHVSHGVQPNPTRTLEQEAAYVGVSLDDYRPMPPDPSYPEGTRLYLSKKDPKIQLVALDLNGTFQIDLNIYYP